MTEQPMVGQSKHVGRSFASWIRATTLALGVVVAVVLVLVVAIYHAEPILKNRVIETLSARFHGPVQLAEFHVSLRNGFQVMGAGLKIFEPGDPNTRESGVQPLIAIAQFRFGADILNPLHTPMRARRLYLEGLELNVPPKEERHGGFKGARSRSMLTSSSVIGLAS